MTKLFALDFKSKINNSPLSRIFLKGRLEFYIDNAFKRRFMKEVTLYLSKPKLDWRRDDEFHKLYAII